MKRPENPELTAATSRETAPEDTALRRLSKAERKRLSMDAWEPSLLRKLLAAQNRLKSKRE